MQHRAKPEQGVPRSKTPPDQRLCSLLCCPNPCESSTHTKQRKTHTRKVDRAREWQIVAPARLHQRRPWSHPDVGPRAHDLDVGAASVLRVRVRLPAARPAGPLRGKPAPRRVRQDGHVVRGKRLRVPGSTTHVRTFDGLHAYAARGHRPPFAEQCRMLNSTHRSLASWPVRSSPSAVECSQPPNAPRAYDTTAGRAPPAPPVVPGHVATAPTPKVAVAPAVAGRTMSGGGSPPPFAPPAAAKRIRSVALGRLDRPPAVVDARRGRFTRLLLVP